LLKNLIFISKLYIKHIDIIFPPHIISKLTGKNTNVLEVEEGVLLKISDIDPISRAKESLKGCKFSLKKYREYKNTDKEMEL